MNDDPPDDLLHPVKVKLEEIHTDLKGGFQTVHDRLDREVTERAWSLERIWQGLGNLRNDILSLFSEQAVSWLTIVPKRLLIELGVVALLALVIYLEDGWRQEWKDKHNALQASEVSNADRHNRELRAAADIKTVELDAIRRDAADAGSLEPVRLCTRPTVPGGGSSPATPGTASAGVHEMPASNPGLRGGEAGPDIHPLLKRLAVGANSVTAALREQQNVR